MPRPVHRMTKPQSLAFMLGDKLFEGAPCKYCQATTRYTSTGNCTACAKTRSHQQYLDRKAARCKLEE